MTHNPKRAPYTAQTKAKVRKLREEGYSNVQITEATGVPAGSREFRATCEVATDCDAGTVELCIYEGRHPKPDGWEEAIAGWLASSP